MQRCGSCATHGPPPEGPAARKLGDTPAAEAPPELVIAPELPPEFPPDEFSLNVDESDFGAAQVPLESADASYAALPGESLAPPIAEDAYGAYTEASPAGFDDFMAGVAGDGQDLVMCSYHGNVVADIQCLNCFQPFCLACLPSGTMCAACKADPVSRAVQSAPDDPVSVTEIGYEPGMDFAASYADHGGIMEGVELGARVAEVASARPKKGAKKSGKKRTSAKKTAVRKPKFRFPVKAFAYAAAAVVALSALGAGGYYVYSALPVAQPTPPPFKGPTGVSLLTPKGTTIAGVQFIEAKVVSPKHVVNVEITIDKKYWAKLKKAPYKSEWPTNVHRNGKHEVAIKVVYQNGLSAQTKKTYVVKNRKVRGRGDR